MTRHPNPNRVRSYAGAIELVTTVKVSPTRTIEAARNFDDTSTAFARARDAGGKTVIVF